MIDEMTAFPILRTKLHRPPVTVDLVPRFALLAWLDRHHRQPLTLISAPAGYGKTTLVSHWIDTLDRPTAWLSLDEQDDDLAVFLTYVTAAIRTLFPAACRDTLALLNARSLPPLAVLVRRFSNDLDALEQDIILALDDYHVIHDMAIHDLLSELLRHPPRTLHLVLMTRRDPPLSLGTLRARDRLTELRQQDLRFTVADTARFLQQMTGLEVVDTVAAALQAKTEGWVLGLRLAALFHRHQGDFDLLLRHLPEQVAYVSEYLMSEVLLQQQPEVQDFLMQTAILNRFCASLCDAVRSEGASSGVNGHEAGISTSEVLLEHLHTENLFLIPQSHEPQWYRYHYVFQAFLQSQLQRRYHPDAIAALHARASRWYAAHNDGLAEAIQHALAAEETSDAVQLVEGHRHDLMNGRQWYLLERILTLFTSDQVATHLELLLMKAWLADHYHRLVELTAILEQADALMATLSSNAPTTRRLRGEIHALRSYYAYANNDPQTALIHAQQALERLPFEHTYAYTWAAMMQCGAYQMQGDLSSALKVAAEVIKDDTSETAIFHSRMLIALSFVYWMEADLGSLQQTARQCLQHAQTWSLPEGSMQALYFYGLASYQRNDLVAAGQHLAVVLNALYLTYAFPTLHYVFALALAYQAQGQADKVQEVLDIALTFAVDSQNAQLIRECEAFQAELALRQDRLPEAQRWARQYDPDPLRLTPHLYVPQLTLAKVWLTEDTPNSRQKAAELLERLHGLAVSMHNTRVRIDVLALQAWLHDVQGDEPAALEKLTDALALAEPGGFIRAFVDLGLPMAKLLNRLLKRRVAVAYIEALLAAFGTDADLVQSAASDPPAPGASRAVISAPSLVEPLTARELDILELLAQRYQNKEIADQLSIAPTTVKTHLKHLYQKLQVSTRRQAIATGHALGLLTHR